MKKIDCCEFVPVDGGGYYLVLSAGELNVAFERDNSGYSDVTLTGEAVCVFSGMIEC